MDDSESSAPPIDGVMEDIRREIVRRAVEQDVDAPRDIYDALIDE